MLQRSDRLPAELVEIIRDGEDQQYLAALTQAALDPRYISTLFACCEDMFAQICAVSREYASFSRSIALLGRIVPFATYLKPFAERLLSQERYDFDRAVESTPTVELLLGLFRLLHHDSRTFSKYIDPAELLRLLDGKHPPTIYLSLRILQLYLHGADQWFETMKTKYLGDDTHESAIDGCWDYLTIDFRFLTLWEEQREEAMTRLLEECRAQRETSVNSASLRTISLKCFDPNVVHVGGVLFPTQLGRQLFPARRLIQTSTVSHNMNRLVSALKVSRPILLHGVAGSGKSLLVQHAARAVGKHDKMVTLHLNEQSDTKALIGFYTTGETPGSFTWKSGVLATAVQQGRWVLIEDIDRAPQEVMSTLLRLFEKGELSVVNRKQTIFAAQGFRVIATIRSSINHRAKEVWAKDRILGLRHWQDVHITMPVVEEQREIARQLYPSLSALLPQLTAAYERIQASSQGTARNEYTKTGLTRQSTPRDFLKWCDRVAKVVRESKTFTSHDMDDIFSQAMDCFVGALPDSPMRDSIASIIAEELHIDPQRREYLCLGREIPFRLDKTSLAIGRHEFSRTRGSSKMAEAPFSMNPHTSRTLERVAAAVVHREPLLLVGETGVGKTTAVQWLASHVGRTLVPFNLSQQSEAGDLLGGFKPVTVQSLIVPLKDEFDELFAASFSTTKNQQFLELMGKQASKGNWKAVCRLWRQALGMVEEQRSRPSSKTGEAPTKKRKVQSKRVLDWRRWDHLAQQVDDLEKRLATGDQTIAFSFIEGSLVKAVRNGDWVLLDEINLASTDTLETIADLLDSKNPSVLLTEAGNVERIDAHPDFRVFAAMNPATDVGKRDLPAGIRSRFTELYVESPDKDMKSLQSIVRSYLRNEMATDQSVVLDASTLYQKITMLAKENKLVDGAGQKPHFSLRTLTRTLSYAKRIAPLCNLRRALYEGFQMGFLTCLDVESERLIQPVIVQHLFSKHSNVRSQLLQPLQRPKSNHEYVKGYPESLHWVRKGPSIVEQQDNYILTPFIRRNLESLVRASSTRQFPVLIQGPTSSGKTSMIEYLAKRTGHHFIRINNHEHTDLQEYLGTYVSGADGKLHFREGVLVRALREGHWIVLDELNLAPTDVLEALNRLLDDNRELRIPETQEVVRPHEDFMLFATQNPAGLYGGRKALSRAFRNRFLELHFDDIPVDELQEIMHRRTHLPETWCRRIVAVYRELAVLRSETRLFEQKSFATLRDLFRWALRPNETIEQLAANGFMLLAERVRKLDERDALKRVIEKVMSASGPRVRICETSLYGSECQEVRKHEHNRTLGVVWTKSMRRLFVLISRAVANNEPVLLVGETGSGKTMVCQILAAALQRKLHIVNAHQNTETGDLIGSQRPVRSRAGVEAELRSQIQGSGLMPTAVLDGKSSTEQLTAAYDRAVAALSEEQQAIYRQSSAHQAIQATRTRVNALFEWVDGSLVHAMKRGGFFLLDEISLADDSVLERLNSVLEPQRSVLLAEKGSLDSFICADPGFQFFATMNPGGDYGKRELSPALRNRFTEIWVPSLDDAEDINEIVHAKLRPDAKGYANVLVEFSQWFKRRYNMSASSSVSIRDMLTWVNFVNTCTTIDVLTCIVHGAALVYIDALGANPAGLMAAPRKNLQEERTECLVELGRLLGFDAGAVYTKSSPVDFRDGYLISGAFALPARQGIASPPDAFSYDTPTTKINTLRVVRALQLSKPVMLEGPPGVGKTTLVAAIASAVNVPLTRINLSEQTDVADLFGSDIPVEGAETGTFCWRDAPFLRAMKRGQWVLLDEMNLASQSVLEALNACLDHREEIFVPELGQTFGRHPDFRLFAAQNPHHQGGGRKGLPASFVNRFTVVFADAFSSQDLILISLRQFPELDPRLIERVVQLTTATDEAVQHRRIGSSGSPWEFNLRDISRWLTLASSTQGLLNSGSSLDWVDLLFAQRFRAHLDRAAVKNLFAHFFEEAQSADLFSALSPQILQVGLGLIRRTLDCGPASACNSTIPNPPQLRVLQSLMLCLDQRWPVILAGPSGAGKTYLIERLAAAVGASLFTISMNADTDAIDLLGGFEQADPHRRLSQAADELRAVVCCEIRAQMASSKTQDLAQALNLLYQSDFSLPIDERLASLLQTLNIPSAQEFLRLIEQTPAIDKARFEWVDGPLVDAVQKGDWVVLDHANLCSSSVLDRLNSLLEPDGALIINEHSTAQGAARTIRPHPDFRIFLTLDPRHGELSRAMRNRAVELFLPGQTTIESSGSDPLHPESAVSRFRYLRAARPDRPGGPQNLTILRDNLGPLDLALFSRLCRQADAGLFDGVNLRTEPSATNLDSTSSDQSTNGLYTATLSPVEVSADLASIQVCRPTSCVSINTDGKLSLQTLHPLNNQPLIYTSETLAARASLRALQYESHLNIESIHRLVEQCQTDARAMAWLRSLERSLNSVASPSAEMSSLPISVKGTLEDFEALTEVGNVSLHELAHVKATTGRVLSFLTTLLQNVASGRPDLVALSAVISAGIRTARSPENHRIPSMSTALNRLSASLTSLLGGPRSQRGGACTELWTVLRPVTPTNMTELEQLLEFERLAQCFDNICKRFDIPLDKAASLRSSFTRVYALAKKGGQDIDILMDDLKKLMPPSPQPTENEEPSLQPHFLLSFQRARKRFCLIHHSREEELAKLDLLCLHGTKDILPSGGHSTDGLLGTLETFAKLIAKDPVQTSTLQHSPSLWHQLRDANDVPLRQLRLLKEEVRTLGGLVSDHAHLLCRDIQVPLDDCLRTALEKALTAIQSSEDPAVRSLAKRVPDASRMNGVSVEDMESERLRGVQHDIFEESGRLLQRVNAHLCARYKNRDSRIIGAANAWTTFAYALLHLYVPTRPFDPALESFASRDVHRRHRDSLTKKLDALKSFNVCFRGDPISLRTRALEQEITAIGEEPPTVQVCRPVHPEIHQLHAELDGLVRILETALPDLEANVTKGNAVLLEPTPFSNIMTIRQRLQEQHRIYDDITSPAVAFIDCLIVAHHLVTQELRGVAVTSENAPLAKLVPFADISLQLYLQDRTFIDAASWISDQSTTISWLRALSLRASIRPLTASSQELVSQTVKQFDTLYTKWQSELNRDHKQAQGKSSLYRFIGGEDDADDRMEESLEELFPTGGNSMDTDGQGTIRQRRIQDEAYTIACLHRSIFLPDAPSIAADTILSVLRTESLHDPLAGTDMALLPAAVLSLDRLSCSLADTGVPARYNLYSDANPHEVSRVFHLTTVTSVRFKELQHTWPEHAIPMDVLEQCKLIQGIGHSAPISHFLPPVEKLHATVNEWQKIASREFSVLEILQDLTKIIVGWRRLELASWIGLFDREWDQCQKSAAAWWFVAYEAVVSTTQLDDGSQQHVQTLLETITGFIAASGLGEYNARLGMLAAFKEQLIAVSSSNRSWNRAIQGLSNLLAYYRSFGEGVEESLTTQRSILEREVKNVVQLASWKDENIDALRQSAQSSHRKLLKLVRKYRALLAKPVSSILEAGVPRRTPSSIARTLVPVPTGNSHHLEVKLWNERAERFKNVSGTADLMNTRFERIVSSCNVPAQLLTFTTDFEDSVTSLRKATPDLLTEQNKALVSHLKTRKRRLLADVLRSLRVMGFQTAVSEPALAIQASMESVFSRTPCLPAASRSPHWPIIEREFLRLLDVMPAVRRAARNHSGDLTAAEVSRSVSLLESMLQQSTAHYRNVCGFGGQYETVGVVMEQFSSFISCTLPTKHSHGTTQDIWESSKALGSIVRIAAEALDAQMRFSGKDYSVINAALTAAADDLETVAQNPPPLLPPGLEATANFEHRARFERIRQEVCCIIAEAQEKHPETEPVVQQVLKWTEPGHSEVRASQDDDRSYLDLESGMQCLFDTADRLLGAVQSFRGSDASDEDNGRWLTNQLHRLTECLSGFQATAANKSLQATLSRLQYVNGGDSTALSTLAKMCHTLRPIMQTYLQGFEFVLLTYCTAVTQVMTTARAMADQFVQIANKGFCTPSEKAESDEASKGNVESGTGLGEGEGAEDISKDIAPNEDLSDLTQNAKREDDQEELQDEKDAVDMADEDFEGEIGDEGEVDEGEGEAEDRSEAEEREIEEETGEVDGNEESAVDEKMWDNAEEEAKKEKKADSGKGKGKQDELSAANQDDAHHDDEDLNEPEAGEEEEEQVTQQQTEDQVDPHARDEDILDLPDDLAMDGPKESDGDSDFASMGDEDGDLADVDDEASAMEKSVDADGESDLGSGEEDTREGDQAADQYDGESEMENPSEQDDASDVLMKDDTRPDSRTDQQADVAAAETGDGAEPDDAAHEKPGLDAGDKAPEQQDVQDDAEMTGEQGTGAKGAKGNASQPQDNSGDPMVAYKQLGDALEQWYNQRRDIENAQQETGDAAEQQGANLADAHFQHVMDETEAQCQALGTASAEQSAALDESQAVPVNEQQSDVDMPFQDGSEQGEGEKDMGVDGGDAMQVDSTHDAREQEQSKAFIGESSRQHDDVEMSDPPTPADSDDVDDVDQQLTQTHISMEVKAEGMSIDEARQHWSEHEQRTRNLALLLTEHLRLILQPTQATKMRGDFRTGKRLNIKRIIPYIASSYKRDKIWMRRSMPSKRAYQVMLAMDDSQSMRESDSRRRLAFDTLAMVCQSLSMLEAGELSVVGFGAAVHVAHDFDTPFAPDAGAHIYRRLAFDQTRTDVRRLLAESLPRFRAARLRARGAAAELWQLLLIVSDGICEEHAAVRQLVRQAREERIMVVFVVVDAGAGTETETERTSIVELQTAQFGRDAAGETQLRMVPYLDSFPFPYYLIVRDVEELPGVLAGALRQWFAEVAETG